MVKRVLSQSQEQPRRLSWLTFDYRVGGYTGVIRPGKPEGLIALHALTSGDEILQ
jgi:hypothetical protein